MQRELWETIVDMVSGLESPQFERLGLRITGATIDLPLELALVRTRVGFLILAGAPQSRWQSDMQRRPGRLRLTVEEHQHERL